MERTFSRLVTTFDEVPPSSCAHDHAYGLHRTHGHRQHDIGVDLKRRPPKSRPAAFPFRRSASFEADLSGTSSRSRKRPARTPPSTFLFLPIHLSNSPEPWQSHSRQAGKTVETPCLRLRSEALSPLSVRSFEGAQSRRQADDAPYPRYIVVRGPSCQHLRPPQSNDRAAACGAKYTGFYMDF